MSRDYKTNLLIGDFTFMTVIEKYPKVHRHAEFYSPAEGGQYPLLSVLARYSEPTLPDVLYTLMIARLLMASSSLLRVSASFNFPYSKKSSVRSGNTFFSYFDCK